MYPTIQRGSNYTAVFTPADWFGVYARPIQSRFVHPVTVDEVARIPGVRVAVDGPMFDALDGTLPGNRIYETNTRNALNGQALDTSFGVDIPASDWRSLGASLSYVPLRGLVVTNHGERPSLAVASVQLFPVLIRDGRRQITSDNSPVEWFAGVGISSTGEFVSVAWQGTLATGSQIGASLGLIFFALTDGGGSTRLFVDGQLIAGPRAVRRIATVIVAREPAPWLWVGLGVSVAAIAAGLGWWWDRSK